MPIDVLCPGCKTRFQVSDKWAGKKGPCPKCKVVIEVPTKIADVVVHAPEVTGPKDSQGRAVLKPLMRIETKVTPLRIGLAVGVVLAVLAAAIYLRVTISDKTTFPWWPLVAGALVIAPLASWSGYAFLRDDELEPYSGRSMLIRTGICAVAYAAVWGIYFLVKHQLLGGKPPETFELIFLAPPLVALGGAASWGSLDLNYGNAMLHFGFYLFVTIVLRTMVGLPIL